MTKHSVLEMYAPPLRRLPERQNVELLPDQPVEAGQPIDPALGELNALVRLIANDSMQEIDGVIHALEQIRQVMRDEGDRVSREIADYASLTHATVTGMKVIADTLNRSKGP
jgi:hypothetical protein